MLGEDFSTIDPEIPMTTTDSDNANSLALLDLSWPTTSNSDFLAGDFMPSRLLQEPNYGITRNDLDQLEQDNNVLIDKETSNDCSKPSKTSAKTKSVSATTAENSGSALVSWLSLFAELDPLANSQQVTSISSDRA